METGAYFFEASDNKRLFADVQSHLGTDHGADVSFILRYEWALAATIIWHPNGLTYLMLLDADGDILRTEAWACA